MRILGIETSCDETAAAVVEDGTRVVSSVVASSQLAFARAGGVIPEEAARRQVECILPVLHQALDDAGIGWEGIDAIAVTRGPGLLGSLLVGTTAARTLAALHQKPLIGVHHTLGHLSSIWLHADGDPSSSIQHPFPILTLSVSGGHTELWLRENHTHGKLLGRTRDDAAGEAFDKGATLLGLPYPGGPAIAEAAEGGDPARFPFPLPLAKDDTLDFSFSGLKTALKYLLRDMGQDGQRFLADLAASYQEAICRHLVHRIEGALALHPDVREVHLVGGVAANLRLRELCRQACAPRPVYWPAGAYCTDNAAMIAAAAFFLAQELGAESYHPFTTETSPPLLTAHSS
ncbi:MAG: O-sialoglycoprotein endopeptidase [Candidatus Peregrinibacteria bacterium Gr01-1014_25]|nr:MAG: O-sialoglycoprotein endopeptidase [Candidatus Peregrinibacteria bacterium Gr01-1014_25]